MGRRGIIFIALPLLLSGCSTSASRVPASESAVPPPGSEVQRLITPFDSYELSRNEYYLVRNALDALIRDCARGRGVDWPVIDRPTDVPEVKNRRRYGVIEGEVARRYGYHVPKGLLNPSDVSDKEAERDSKLSTEQREAAYDQTEGCSLLAQKRLMEGVHVDYGKYNNLNKAIFDRARETRAVKKALHAWSDCMHRRGFTYSDPLQAVSDERWWKSETGPASRYEVSAAVADEACKERTNLVSAWFSAERRLQLEAIEDNEAYFHALQDAKSRQLAAARRVLRVAS